MRTKILKFGMPLMAFLLAIVFAFATNGTPQTDNGLVTGYIFQKGNCNVTSHDCDISGSQICTIGSKTVYATKSGTICLNPLMRF